MTKSFFDEPNIEDLKTLSPKDGALRFIEFMETVARDSSSDKALGPEEKKTLAVAREGLRPAFGLLSASMGTHADATYTALSWIMCHSFAIGQHVGFLDKRAKKVFEKVKGWSANAARVVKNADEKAKKLAILADLLKDEPTVRMKYLQRNMDAELVAAGLKPVGEKTIRRWRKEIQK